jgi:hypothetical protein
MTVDDESAEKESKEAEESRDPLPNIPQQRLAKSSAFQTDVRQFQDDLRDGKLDPLWMEAAMTASARRMAGEFEEWRRNKVAEAWGLAAEDFPFQTAGE